jgi:hypothetical protein
MTTTENTRTLVQPASGELVDLNAPTTELAAGLERLDELVMRLGDFRQAVTDELARRMDTANSRTERVGDYVLKTNAPTSEEYPVRPLREALRRLVELKVLDPVVLERVVKTPPPTPPEPKVDKRELNKLKNHADPRVARAIGAVRQRTPNRRTLKVERDA